MFSLSVAVQAVAEVVLELHMAVAVVALVEF
jgi:hypothetical protein